LPINGIRPLASAYSILEPLRWFSTIFDKTEKKLKPKGGDGSAEPEPIGFLQLAKLEAWISAVNNF
jgi:hypothetical protein